MAGIKIVDLPAVGRDLAATDLFEMSLAGGTGSRKITGQEIMNASKLSVNNTPVINGTSGRIFFQDAANVLQQSANLFWDSLNNTLNILGNASLNNIFAEGNIIVDTANVWLSNGYAIGEYSTGNNRIEFYTTKLSLITNGNDVMTLFNSGNVAIGTTTDAGFKLDVNGSARVLASHQIYRNGALGSIDLNLYNGQAGWQGGMHYFTGSGGSGQRLTFYSGGVLGTNDRMSIFASGNVAIGTTTDNGFRLDVNGTARIVGNTLLDSGILATSAGNTRLQSSVNYFTHNRLASSGVFGWQISSYGGLASFWRWDGGSGDTEFGGTNNFGAGALKLYSASAERMRIFYNGNVGINTTTDAGYKLDVNGTARFIGRIDAGSFTPGAGASAYTIATTGRISAGNGISFRSPIYGDSIFVGFVPASNHEQIQVFTSGNNALIFGGSGNNSGTMVFANPNYNPNSGTADKNIFAVGGQYQTSGTYSGIIRGFYYNPSLTSMTGVTAHYAWHSVSGRFKIEGLPTSPTGLTAGELWNNGGVINIV